jgi:hypothetical protein
MRVLLAVVLAVGVVGLWNAGLRAQDKKEVTLKGEIACAKCTFHQADKCGTAISVKEGGKDVVYLLLDKGMQEPYYEGLCGGDKKPGTVTGVVTTKDGKKYVKPSKVEFAKQGADARGAGVDVAQMAAGCCGAPARSLRAGCCGCCR